MKLRRYKFDWRSNFPSQIASINTFINNNTIKFLSFDNEYIYVVYTEVNPSIPLVFDAKNINHYGEANLQALFEGKTIRFFHIVEDVVLFIYDQ